MNFLCFISLEYLFCCSLAFAWLFLVCLQTLEALRGRMISCELSCWQHHSPVVGMPVSVCDRCVGMKSLHAIRLSQWHFTFLAFHSKHSKFIYFVHTSALYFLGYFHSWHYGIAVVPSIIMFYSNLIIVLSKVFC